MLRLWAARYRGGDSPGFLLVAALWILGALATLAAIYALYVKESSAAFVGLNDRLAAQGLALAGVELAVYRLTAIPDARPSQGAFRFQLGSAVVTVDFRAENGRIDLNLAPKEVFSALFVGFGARAEEASQYADRIVAWRTPPTAGSTDSEASVYGAAGKSYGPRRGPFQHVNELGLVLGLPPELVEHALPFVTVYSGHAEVNVLVAAPEVLAALPGVTPATLHVLLSQRANAPQDILRAQLGLAARYANAQPGEANRMIVEVQFDGTRRIRSEIVVLMLQGDVEPFRVLSWRDGTEEPLSDERPKARLQ